MSGHWSGLGAGLVETKHVEATISDDVVQRFEAEEPENTVPAFSPA